MDRYGELYDRLVQGLCSIYRDRIKSIILYGSVARGTGTEESDIDIAAIIREDTEEAHERMTDLAVDLELEYDVVLSIVLIDQESFTEWGNVLPYYINVKKDGVTLWSAA